MNVFTVNLKPKVLEYNDGKVKIFVDYPGIEQGQEIKSLSYKAFDFDIQWEKTDENKYLPKIDTLKTSELATINDIGFQTKLLRIKYCIKGWEGINDEEGKPFECIIENNEMRRDVLIRVMVTDWIDIVYEDMAKLLKWDETDKKKFISSEDSNLKAV